MGHSFPCWFNHICAFPLDFLFTGNALLPTYHNTQILTTLQNSVQMPPLLCGLPCSSPVGKTFSSSKLSWHLLYFSPDHFLTHTLITCLLISSGLSTLWISFTIKISKKFLGGSRPCRTETNGSLVAGPILDVIPCRLGFLTHIRTSSSCGFLTCACLCGFLVLIHLTHMLSVCSALPFW